MRRSSALELLDMQKLELETGYALGNYCGVAGVQLGYPKFGLAAYLVPSVFAPIYVYYYS